jgi:hypothetical protein
MLGPDDLLDDDDPFTPVSVVELADSSDDEPSLPLKFNNISMINTSLRAAFPNDQARGQVLNATRKEMYDALALYHAHVRGVISLLLGLVTIVFALSGFLLKESAPSSDVITIVKASAPTILVAVLPVSLICIVLLGRYYKLYVAALVYAAKLHHAEGIGDHLWFSEVERGRQKFGQNSDRKYIWKRTYGWPHTWLLYSILILIIGLTSVAIAIILWVRL